MAAAARSGAQEEQGYQQWRGAPSTSPGVGQACGSTDEENVQNIEIPYSEPPNSSISDCARFQNNEKHNFSNTEHEQKAKCRTSEIPDCKLHLKSPSGRESPRSREQSRKRSRSPSVSSCSSSRSRSRSRSSSRSASRSREYRRRYRRTSRSSSRSRSRSLGPRCRRHPSSYYRRQRSSSYKRYHRSPRRYHRSPRKYRSRSRSRSHVRTYYGRYRSQSRSRSRSLSRKHYRFVRRAYPASFRSWRGRSRTRSKSRSQSRLRLTEEDRQKLLEIAKANAAKALGKSVDLPPSLKKDSWLTNTLHRNFEADSGKNELQPLKKENVERLLTKRPSSRADKFIAHRVPCNCREDLHIMPQSPNLIDVVPTKVSPRQGANLLSTDRAVVQPVLDKEGNKLARSLKKDEAKKAPGQWIPIQCQRNVLNRLQ